MNTKEEVFTGGKKFVAEPNEYRNEGMDIYLKTYFALKDLDKKEKKE